MNFGNFCLHFFVRLFIIFFCLSNIYDGLAWAVSITFDTCPPSRTDIREGNPASIVCIANRATERAEDQIEYFWDYRNPTATSPVFDQHLSPSSKFSFNKAGSDGTLNIRSVDRADNGKQFLCLRGPVRSSKRIKCEEPTTLNVFWLNPNVTVLRVQPSVTTTLTMNHVNVTLECAVSASDRPTYIIWFLNGARLNKNMDNRFSMKDSFLTIHLLTLETAGVYHCFVETSAGKILSRHPLPVFPEDLGKYFSDPVLYVRQQDRSVAIPVNHFSSKITVLWFDLKTFGHEVGQEVLSARTNTELLTRKGALYIENFGDLRPHTTMRIDDRMGDSYFYMIRIVFIRGEFPPINFVCEVVRARMSPLDGGKNFEPPISRIVHNFVPEKSTFTQRLYLPFPDYSHLSAQVWIPQPNVTWFNPNGTRIPLILEKPFSRIRVVRGTNLEINNAKVSDSGSYTVRIDNVAGHDEAVIQLLVTVAPRFFDKEPKVHRGTEDDVNFQMDCPSHYISPPPASEFYWILYHRASSKSVVVATTSSYAISNLPQNDLVKINFSNGSLMFRRLLPDHAGIYLCMIVTNMTSDSDKQIRRNAKSANITLIVRRRLKLCPNVENNIFFEEGTSSYIDCAVTGEAPIDLQWYKKVDGRFVPVSDITSSKFSDGKKQRLVIVYVKRESSGGEYKLVATNNKEPDVEKIFSVVVGLKPKVRIQGGGGNVTAREYTRVMLPCLASGDPSPTVGWLFTASRSGAKAEPITIDSHGNKTRNKDGRVLFSNGTLYIAKARQHHSGLYQCTAANKYFLVTSNKLTLLVSDYSASTEEAGKSSIMRTVIVAVSCAVLYLGIIIFFSICCNIRMQRKRHKPNDAGATLVPVDTSSPTVGMFANGHRQQYRHVASYEQSNHQLIRNANMDYHPLLTSTMRAAAASRPEDHSTQQLAGASIYDCQSYSSSGAFSSDASRPYSTLMHNNTPVNSVVNESTIERICRCLQLDRRCIHFKPGLLGRGQFGLVRLATYLDAPVLVKEFSTNDRDRLADFTEQIKMYSKCDHDYVTKLIGVCTESLDPPLMVLEYCEYNNLSDLLLQFKKRIDGDSPLQEDLQLKMCLQVAQALEHFHSLGFIHSEVAARNVLVTVEYNLKLTNLGPCLDRFVNHYATNASGILMPVRWLPPESIVQNRFSIWTDIWSYAILVNEIFSLGERPFARLTDSAVLASASNGTLRPKVIKHVPNQLHPLLEKCWSLSPEQRPTAAQLVASFRELTRDLVDV